MNTLAIIAALVAGALGALLRYGVTRAFAGRPSRLPWAVLIVNIAGSLVAGVAFSLEWSAGADDWVHLILVSGFAGGLTTFSTFSVETVQLIHEKRTRIALVSVVANLVLGAAGLALGFIATQWVVFTFGLGGASPL